MAFFKIAPSRYVEAVTKITEAGEDVLLVVEFAVARGGENWHAGKAASIGMNACQGAATMQAEPVLRPLRCKKMSSACTAELPVASIGFTTIMRLPARRGVFGHNCGATGDVIAFKADVAYAYVGKQTRKGPHHPEADAENGDDREEASEHIGRRLIREGCLSDDRGWTLGRAAG